MGSVRFELTIDGSLRYVKRFLHPIMESGNYSFIIKLVRSITINTAGARCHSGLGHDPLQLIGVFSGVI